MLLMVASSRFRCSRMIVGSTAAEQQGRQGILIAIFPFLSAMDPRRGCWECSSSEDVSRPLLPVHDDDDRPAGSRSCSALGNKYLAVASGPAACALICALGNSAGTRRRATCSACWPGCSSGGSRTPCRSPSPPWRRCSCSRRSASRPPTTSPRHTWTTSSPSSSAASSSRSPSSTTASTDAPPSTSRPFTGSPHLLLLGICGTTVFISMWIHNTVCTIMMVQVATGILQRLPRDQGRDKQGEGPDRLVDDDPRKPKRRHSGEGT